MEVIVQPTQLLALVAQLNSEVQNHIISELAQADLDCMVGWNDPGEDMRLDVSWGNRLIAVRSIVLPVVAAGREGTTISMGTARIEMAAKWRMLDHMVWLPDANFGEQGSLVFTLASLDPDHTEQVATLIAATIVKHLEPQVQEC